MTQVWVSGLDIAAAQQQLVTALWHELRKPKACFTHTTARSGRDTAMQTYPRLDATGMPLFASAPGAASRGPQYSQLAARTEPPPLQLAEPPRRGQAALLGAGAVLRHLRAGHFELLGATQPAPPWPVAKGLHPSGNHSKCLLSDSPDRSRVAASGGTTTIGRQVEEEDLQNHSLRPAQKRSSCSP